MTKRFKSTPKYTDLGHGQGQTRSWDKYHNMPGIHGRGSSAVSSWFLGPRGENADLFSELIQQAIEAATRYRSYFHPEDPPAITEETKHSPEYLAGVGALKHNFNILLQKLQEYTTPYYSLRYQGHMLWDTTIPGMLGFFATMLHNPNNVTVQASTLTTFLEMVVGEDLCEMVAYPFSKKLSPWAHITADGSVANLEAAWAHRECKFLPLAVKAALDDKANDDKIGSAAKLTLTATNDSPLAECSTWQLLNVPLDDVIALPARIVDGLTPEERQALVGVDDANEDEEVIAAVWQLLLHGYSVSTVGVGGMVNFYSRNDVFSQPVYIVPKTAHYSWPKSAAVLGIGTKHVRTVDVDADARLSIESLRKQLDDCLTNRIPVALVVAVLGSTEEGACDPLDEVLAVREEYRAKGLEFNVHADAAWGGYLVSTVRKDFDQRKIDFTQQDENFDGDSVDPEPFVEDAADHMLNHHTARQMKKMRECDSITIDPHKCGYIQYPAGAMCHRNSDMKNLTTFGAPVIGNPGTAPGVGEFGIEGSKPGAAAAAVWLSHAVIRPSVSGYGKLLNLSLLNTKLFYLHLLTMRQSGDRYVVVPLPRLPAERTGGDVAAQKKTIANAFADATLEEFRSDIGNEMFGELGPDENIIDYVFNFKVGDDDSDDITGVCTDLDTVNRLQESIYERLHVEPGRDINHYDLLITQTTMSVSDYGKVFMETYLKRLGITIPDSENYSLKVNRTVVMDPWLNTAGEDPGGFFNVIMGVLRQTVVDEVDALSPTDDPKADRL